MHRIAAATILRWAVGFGCLGLAQAVGTSSSGTVVWLINGAGANAQTILNGGTPFVTNFKGVDDVTITLLTGTLSANFVDRFPPASSTCNNPVYISNFIGATTNGTGDGTAGGISFLQPQSGAAVQYDFAIPFDVDDRLFIVDTDVSEEYTITAFTASGGVYTQVPLTGWIHQGYSGRTNQLPDSSWPIWNPIGAGPRAGTLTASSDAPLTEPLDVFTPDRAISRIVIESIASRPGTPGFQFYTPVGLCDGQREVLIKTRASKVVKRQNGMLGYRASVRFGKPPADGPTGPLSLAVALPPGVTVTSSSSSLKGLTAVNDGSLITWTAFNITKARAAHFRFKARIQGAQGDSLAVDTTVYRWDGTSNTCPTTAAPLQVRHPSIRKDSIGVGNYIGSSCQ